MQMIAKYENDVIFSRESDGSYNTDSKQFSK